MSGHLPELVDFRLSSGGKLILFIREGEAFYRKHLDMTRQGAGLWAINPAFGNAVFQRSDRQVRWDDVSEAAYERYHAGKYITVGIDSEMAANLTRVLWGEEVHWDGQEGVQPAQPLDNAAD